MKKALGSVLLLLWGFQSWAAGPSNGGGGDVVVLPNDDVVLADPFLDSGAPQPNNMPPLRALNPRILQLARAYLDAAGPTLDSLVESRGSSSSQATSIRSEIEKLTTRKSDLRVYAVQDQAELNNFCAPGGRKTYKLPDGYSVQQVACTAGNETFIVEPLFLRLSLKDQTLLLIHERLTTLRDAQGGKNYSAVARLTTGLGVFLQVYKEQSKSQFRVLADDEVKRLTDFYVAIEEIEYRNSDPSDDSFQWNAHPNGGGRVHHRAEVDPTAIVSIESVVPRDSRVAEGAQVLQMGREYGRLELGARSVLAGARAELMSGVFHSRCRTAFVLEDGAEIRKAQFKNESVKMRDSDPQRRGCIDSVVLATASAIRDSVVNLRGEKLSEVRLGDASIRVGARTQLSQSKIAWSGNLEIAEGQTLQDGKLDSDSSYRFHPIGTQVSPLNLDLANNGTYSYACDRAENFNFQTPSGLQVAGKERVVSYAFWGDNRCEISQLRFRLRVSPEANSDPHLYVLTLGKILPAGVERVRVVDPGSSSSAWRLSSEVSFALRQSLKSAGISYEEYDGGFYVPFPISPVKSE